MTSWIDTELEKCKAATEGPWTAMFVFGSADLPASIIHETGKIKIIADVACPDNEYICEVHPEAKNPTPDFRFIASARTNYPRALELLKDAATLISGMICEECIRGATTVLSSNCDRCAFLAKLEAAK